MKLSPRILALMSVVVLLSAILIVPALAAPIDYNDYVTKVQVDGDNDLVTVTIPADLAFVVVYDHTGEEVYRGTGSIHDVVLSDWTDYIIDVYVFGYPWGESSGLDLSYIPVGTQIASGFGFSWDPDDIVTGITTGGVNYFYSPTDYYVTNQLGDIMNEQFFTDVYTIESVDNASSLFVNYRVAFEPVSSPVASVYVMDTQMVFTISSLLRQQQLTGKTNAILKEVEAQLAEQGKTLDDIKASQEETNDKLDQIIDSEISGEPPAGSDIVDDYESAEDQLMDSVGGGSDAFADMTLTAWDKIYAYSQSFLAFGVLFEMFSDIPMFQGLLFISLSLGTFAFLVNLSAMAGRALTRRTAKRGGK